MAIYLFLVDLVDCSRSSWPIQPPTRKAQEFWICSHREARRLLKELKELDYPIMLIEPKVLMVLEVPVELQELLDVEELLKVVDCCALGTLRAGLAEWIRGAQVDSVASVFFF